MTSGTFYSCNSGRFLKVPLPAQSVNTHRRRGPGYGRCFVAHKPLRAWFWFQIRVSVAGRSLYSCVAEATRAEQLAHTRAARRAGGGSGTSGCTRLTPTRHRPSRCERLKGCGAEAGPVFPESPAPSVHLSSSH